MQREKFHPALRGAVNWPRFKLGLKGEKRGAARLTQTDVPRVGLSRAVLCHLSEDVSEDQIDPGLFRSRSLSFFPSQGPCLKV